MPYLPSFPEPGEYLRYWDVQNKGTQYLELIAVEGPLVYPVRFPSISAGASGSLQTLGDLEPDRRLSHRYCAYIGVRPGLLVRLYHPYTTPQNQFDKKPEDINFDLTRVLSYQNSPAEKPTKFIWIAPGAYPGFEFINVMERTITPEISIVVAKFRVKEEEPIEKVNTIAPETLERLRRGTIPSLPVSFGGPI